MSPCGHESAGDTVNRTVFRCPSVLGGGGGGGGFMKLPLPHSLRRDGTG